VETIEKERVGDEYLHSVLLALRALRGRRGFHDLLKPLLFMNLDKTWLAMYAQQRRKK